VSALRPPRRVAVVGASAAGLAAAETLRREGYDGTITLVGDESYAPYDRPPLSKEILAGRWEADRLPLRATDDLEAIGLELRLGAAATGLDLTARTVTLADGGVVAFDGLVVATGVRPRHLPGERAHTLRTLDDALALKERIGPGRRLAVVGAGFLGAEAAAVARGLGAEVTVLEPAPVPLAHAVGETVGRVLSQVHRDHGVDLRTGVPVAEVVPAGVRLADGTVVEADEVLVAIGSHPNTEWLEGSGLTVADGLVCDEFSAAAPGVYGAGDVARWHNPLFDVTMRIEHRTNAAEQGMAAARNLLHPQAPKAFAPVPYFWSDQYGMKIQFAGHARPGDTVTVEEGDVAGRSFLAVYRRRDRPVAVLSLNQVRLFTRWRRRLDAAPSRTDSTLRSEL
jgi:NADPH-dependent 2,4-dienoyl-CoA reductase/sulfur reductase-like enzyme